DNTGNSYRQGADFTSTFGQLCDSLALISPDTSLGAPPPAVPNQAYMRLGQRYRNSLVPLSPLFSEVDAVRAAEPNATLDGGRNRLNTFNASLNGVANLLLTGVPN